MFKEIPLPSRYGELGASGELLKDAKFCAVTGQPIEAGDPEIKVQDALVFYRIKVHIYRRMTNEDHEALYAKMRSKSAWPSGSKFDSEANRVVVPPPAEVSSTFDFNEAFPTNPPEETRNRKGSLGNG